MQSINQEGWSDAEEMGSQDEYQAASPLCKPCLQSPILRADATVAAKELNSLGKGMSVHGADVCPLTGPLTYMVSPVAQMIKNLPATQETQVLSLDQEDPLKKKGQPTPVFLPGKSHVQRSLAGYSPWGRK